MIELQKNKIAKLKAENPKYLYTENNNVVGKKPNEHNESQNENNKIIDYNTFKLTLWGPFSYAFSPDVSEGRFQFINLGLQGIYNYDSTMGIGIHTGYFTDLDYEKIMH